MLAPGGTLYVYKLPNRRSYLEADREASRPGSARRHVLARQAPDDLHLRRALGGRAAASATATSVRELRLANMLPLTLPGRLARRLTPVIWRLNRGRCARVPGLRRLATNVELVAARPR